jgi:predicted Zn-dependent protease
MTQNASSFSLQKSVLNALLLVGMTCVLLFGTTAVEADVQPLPDLGSPARAVYSAEAEHRLGHQVMVQIRQSREFVDDPELQAYVQQLGESIARGTGRSDFRFFIVRDPSINAFALPGGYIGLNTGLILRTSNESELAAVLAHEIEHVVQQHWSRMMAARKQRSGLTAAALLASMILVGSGQQAGEAGIALTSAINTTQELSYSRDYEREADRLGIQLLARAGYRPEAMANFFGKLQKSARLSDSGAPEYMRTHPVTTNRIAEARDRARKLKVHVTHTSNRAFMYAKARIVALYSPSTTEARTLMKSRIAPVSKDAYDYGEAMLAMRTNRLASAMTIAQDLRKRHPKDLRFHMLEADIKLDSGDKKGGLDIYRDIHRHEKNNREIMLRYADALINYGGFADAYKMLKSVIRTPPEHPRLQQLYARAAGEIGKYYESHRAMAEYYYLMGNTDAALEQLNIAKNIAGTNQYLLAGAEARSKEIEAERAQQIQSQH